MWGKIIIPMYRLWLNSLYGLYGPWCPLSSKRLINLISLSWTVFTRGQFWPSGIVVACVCLCVRPSVRVCGNHLLVRAITRHPFKLGSPNLDHRCKRPWLRSLLFWGVIDLDLQGQIKLQSQKLPHFELLGTITHHLFKLGSPNLGKRCKIPGLRLLLTLGLIGLDLQFHFQFWNPFS